MGLLGDLGKAIIGALIDEAFSDNNDSTQTTGHKKTRRTRSDCTVGTFEKKHGLPPGTIRNDDGRDTRSDKKIGTIRKERGMK